MKVDEKMIEALAFAIAPHLQRTTPVNPDCDDVNAGRDYALLVARHGFTAILSAAPTDYAELVEDAEWLRDIGEQELFVCNVEWQDRLYAIAERIELLSALSVDGVVSRA